MNILVAIDSFKGTLSSTELSLLIHDYLTHKGHLVKMIPISDGGEGFIDSIQTFLNCKIKKFQTYGPLMKELEVEYILYHDQAFIELHSTSGITRISKQMLNPMKTTTFGLGLLIKHVISKGAKKVIIGLGGSATNDGGAGMLQALGVKFYHKNELIHEPMNGELIGLIDDIELSSFNETIKGVTFEIASDVTNPLLGKLGSSHVFSKQKGATLEQMDILESNMSNYAHVVEKKLNKQTQFLPGAGAAGGVGFACLSFLHAHLHSGINYMIDLLDIEKYIARSDLIIVGEGRLDHQTRFGKAPFGIASIAKKHHKKVIGLFGSKDESDISDVMDEVYSIVPKYANENESIENPVVYFKKMLENIKW